MENGTEKRNKGFETQALLKNNEVVELSTVGSISFVEDLFSKNVQGLVSFELTGEDVLKSLPSPVDSLILKKSKTKCIFNNVVFESMSHQIAVDDITTEVHYTFSASSTTGWIKE